MPSPLDYNNSEEFRRRLLTKNLTPYSKAPNRPQPPYTTEYNFTVLPVVDSNDALIDTPVFADNLYRLNQFGSEGGYQQVPDPNALLNTKSNEGEYGPLQQDAKIVGQSVYEVQRMKSINPYGDGTLQISDAGVGIESLERPELSTNVYNNQPYPTTFVPSTYAPVSILLQQDPGGSNGLLSQDSYLASLGAKSLKQEFLDRIAAQIRKDTIGRANLFTANDGVDLLNIAAGITPLIEPNYQITMPQTPILAATDFALRLAGSILPISTIPGSYFDPSINNRQLSTIEQLQVAFAGTRNIFGNFFTRLLGGTQTGSVLFLQNTGAGTRSRLFFNLDYNKFKPNYNRTAFNRLGGALVATTTQDSNFYIGSTTSDPSQILSPAGEIPVDQYGREQQAQVYGPSEIAKLYEGPDKSTKLGANGPAYIDGGGIEGGFTWVSPKYKDNAGKRVGIGGEVTSQDQDFKPSSYNTTESTNLEFKEGSILYDTQKLIDSQPQGGRRLQHAGNAIDQVSKVFNDGYVEMTKGSRVYKYIGAIGQEVGTEYCRVFAKDTPYLQYNDLQKTDGITTENRRFPMSVLDKTYNLNIAPNKREGGMDSTNLTLNTATNTSGAKKYMFSLENLAWRTSSTPGFSTSELPVCEKGPNGGRIMWFPPYDLKFNETVTANWKPQDFLGRPEPIYTYTNTSRGGTLSWKIVVDHPSVLNVIVNKVLGNESNKVRINGIIDSFFAGCRKYDLYELAKKYETIKPSDLYELQEIVTSKEASREALSVLINDVATGNNDTKNSGGNPGGQPVADPNTTTPQPNIKKFQNFALYFPNDQPKPPDSSVIGYPSYYSIYDAQTQYKNGAELENFFNTVVTANYTSIQQELLIELGNFLETNKAASVTIELVASTSAAGTNSYNLSLANRRLEAVDQFIFSNDKIRAAIDRVKIIKKPLGEDASVQSFDGNANKFVLKTLDKKCTEIGDQEVFTTNAMACRRVTITNINVTNPPPPAPPNTPATVQNPSTGNGGGLNGQTTSPSQLAPLQPQKTLSNPNNVERKYVQRDNITKRVIRAMISECDYFETIKEETPMVYDNLRDQLKFFQPAFHSMTPEGLNSRLTFLQQCMRPGDTIPTVKEFDGTTQLQYNNATNTAFGTPPVLILRVGDFYNTKIIPNNLTLNFEGLDINPEGIGVQPMIANVQLSFNFVGGSGLAEAVDKLQNALSFNYYANTEIWDDRADATDQYIKVLDKQFLQDVGIPPPPLQNQVQNNYTFSNTDTIGKRTSTVITTTTESGDISYREFMDSFVAGTQTYFQSVLNKNREVLRQYNNAMMQIWSLQTLYTRGTFVLNDVNQNDVSLFGKPDSIEKMIQPIFDEYVASINTSNVTLQDPYIEFISSDSKQYTRSTLNAIKRNYTKFINDKKGTFLGPLFSIIQDMTLTQQSYIQFIARANTTPAGANPSTGMDGYQEQNGNVRIFETAGTPNVTAGSTATNTLDEMNTDILKIRQDLIDFHQKTISRKSFDVGGKNYKGWLIYGETPAGAQVQTPTAREVLDVVFFPFSDNVNFVEVQQFRRMYLLCSQDLKDENYQNFKDAIIGSIKNNPDLTTGGADYRQIEIEFDNYWKVNTKPIFDKETEIANTFLTTIETQPTEFKNYLNYTPFPSKERVLTYQLNTTPLTFQKTLIKSLGATLNINSDKLTWNSQKDVSAYISKAKLN